MVVDEYNERLERRLKGVMNLCQWQVCLLDNFANGLMECMYLQPPICLDNTRRWKQLSTRFQQNDQD